MKKLNRGIEIFDGKYTKYGGHWQSLARITALDYLSFSFHIAKFSYNREWYDGWHNSISLGIVSISWGG